MKKIVTIAFAAAIAIASSCGFFVDEWDAFKTWTPWVRGIDVEGDVQQYAFDSVCVDSADSIYAVAGLQGGTRFTFGPGISLDAVRPGWPFTGLVRYDRDGTALWARSAVSGSSSISFDDVACDPSGNPVVCGSFSGVADFDLGDGVVERGGFSNGSSFAVAKYSPEGKALWARAVKGGNSNSAANAVATDGSGNIYSAGFCLSKPAEDPEDPKDITYDFGGGVTLPLAPSMNKCVVVKYNSSGTAQWARSLDSAPYYGKFLGITADSEGNAYASLYLGSGHPGTYDFGSGVSFTMSGIASLAFVVKYDPSGTVLWAAPVYGYGQIAIHGLRIAPDGNILGCGAYFSSESDPTSSVSFNGTILKLNPSVYMAGAMICKFTPDGAPLWMRNVVSPANGSYLYDLAIDSEGGILAAGYIIGPGPVDFGSGVSSIGACAGAQNSLFMKYGADGTPLMARSPELAPESSQFNAIAVDSSGNAYLAGYQCGQGDFRYGEGLILAGPGTATNAALVKYLGRE